ncbi:MAG TPA: GNAT family N-acetyltransferase [Symbiobacteriaceae bacterium]|jgi:putative acetyltransferase|nr:GNAT family N-acetyltransferase [Symbiobacteriaceae bacterium]
MELEAIIRPMRPEDATEWYDLRTQPGVIWGTLQLPSLSLDDVRTQCVADPNAPKLCAEVDGRVAGTIMLWVGKGAQRHTGYLGMMVHDAYQGRGLGKKLMAAMLDLADNWLLLERVVLEVFPDNERAIHLYRSFGFEQEGYSPAMARRDGQVAGHIRMARLRGRAAAAVDANVVEMLWPAERAASPIAPVIKGAKPEYFRALYTLYMHPLVRPWLGLLPSMQEDELRKELCSLPRGHHLLVAEHEGQVIGAVHLVQHAARRSHNGTIKSLAVHPAWQGRGAGTALLQAAVDLAEKWLGLTRLEMTVPAPAGTALALGEKLGFVQEAVLRADLAYNGRLIDTVVMGRVTQS